MRSSRKRNSLDRRKAGEEAFGAFRQLEVLSRSNAKESLQARLGENSGGTSSLHTRQRQTFLFAVAVAPGVLRLEGKERTG